MQILSLSNAAGGSHGGAELGTGDFAAWYSINTMFPSTGLTRIANAGPANVLTNFNTVKRFELELNNQNRLAFLAYNGSTLRLIVDINVGNLSLYKNGTLVAANVVPVGFGGALNDDASGNQVYSWNTTIDTNDILAFASTNTTFRMRLVNNENTIRFGDFTRLSGGPFTNDYRRAIGFDYRLGTGITSSSNPLLVAGASADTVNFGGLPILRQALLGYDELGTFVLTGAADGSPTVSSPKEITYLHKTSQTIPLEICTIEATGSGSLSPITNNCNFNLNTPTSGTTNLKLFAHFVNTSLPAGEQALPCLLYTSPSPRD